MGSLVLHVNSLQAVLEHAWELDTSNGQMTNDESVLACSALRGVCSWGAVRAGELPLS